MILSNASAELDDVLTSGIGLDCGWDVRVFGTTMDFAAPANDSERRSDAVLVGKGGNVISLGFGLGFG